MNEFLFLCLVGVLFFGALILFMVISRFLGSQTRRGYYPPAGTYDDPNIRSSGSIGGGMRREYDDPNIRSGGSFGGQGGRPPGAAGPPRSSRREHDDPNIRSGGSFGG